MNLIESEIIELKDSYNDLNKDKIKSTIKAFHNWKGGKLYIGFNDYGELIGIEKNKIDNIQKELSNFIFENNINSQITLMIENEKYYIVVFVKMGKNLIYEKDGKAFSRIGSTTRKLKGNEIECILSERNCIKEFNEKLNKNFKLIGEIDWLIDNNQAEKLNKLYSKLIKLSDGRLINGFNLRIYELNTRCFIPIFSKKIIFSENELIFEIDWYSPLYYDSEKNFNKYFHNFYVGSTMIFLNDNVSFSFKKNYFIKENLKKDNFNSFLIYSTNSLNIDINILSISLERISKFFEDTMVEYKTKFMKNFEKIINEMNEDFFK